MRGIGMNEGLGGFVRRWLRNWLAGVVLSRTEKVGKGIERRFSLVEQASRAGDRCSKNMREGPDRTALDPCFPELTAYPLCCLGE
jgi:hypothetical protein